MDCQVLASALLLHKPGLAQQLPAQQTHRGQKQLSGHKVSYDVKLCMSWSSSNAVHGHNTADARWTLTQTPEG